MLENAWVRFLATSLLLAAWEMTDTIGRLVNRVRRPPSPRTPRWDFFVGFAAVTMFYVLLAREGGALFGGGVNAAGFLLAMAAMVLRPFVRGGALGVRYPHLTARLLFFAALPMAIGAPHGWLVLTLPQAIRAAAWARRADAMLAQAAGTKATPAWAEAPRRILPGLW